MKLKTIGVPLEETEIKKLAEHCKTNGLKLGAFVARLIRQALKKGS